MADKTPRPSGRARRPRLSPEQVLEKAIAKNPSDVSITPNWLTPKHERYEQAETMLIAATKLTNIRERLRTCRSAAKEQLAIAHRPPPLSDARIPDSRRWDESNRRNEIYRGRPTGTVQPRPEVRTGVRLKRAKTSTKRSRPSGPWRPQTRGPCSSTGRAFSPSSKQTA
jgi:hypothetical protein